MTKLLKPPYLYVLLLLLLCILGIVLYNTFGSKESDESTNHEYNIETPSNSENGTTDNNDDQVPVIQGGQRPGNQNQNSNNNNNGRTGGKPGQNTGAHGNNVNNNAHQNPNGQPNSNNSGNQAGAGVNPDIMDQFNHNNGNNSQHPSQPAETLPSQGYLNLLGTVQKDYNNASSAYSIVRRQRYRTRATDQTISHYLGNIDNNLNSLRSDSKNYNALGSSQKQLISSFGRLADELERSYYNYPTEPSRRRPDNSQQQNEDDMYGGYGREL